VAGDYIASQPPAEEYLAICNDSGVRLGYGPLMLGLINIHRGDYETGRVHSQAALDVARRTEQLAIVPASLLGLGLVAVREGAHAKAQQLFLESKPWLQALGWQDWVVQGRCVLAYAARGLGEVDDARRHLAQAVQWAIAHGSFTVLLLALPATALLLLDQGEVERAVEIYALACTLPAVANSRWYEDVAGRPIAEAATTLAPQVVEAAQQRGRARDVWATAAELLEELEAQAESLTR
jgi:hypothetical protein